MTQTIMTDTAVSFQKIRKHQPVIILTPHPGKTLRGIILTPGKNQSHIRFVENGILRERKIKNEKLIPLKTKKT